MSVSGLLFAYALLDVVNGAWKPEGENDPEVSIATVFAAWLYNASLIFGISSVF